MASQQPDYPKPPPVNTAAEFDKQAKKVGTSWYIVDSENHGACYAWLEAKDVTEFTIPENVTLEGASYPIVSIGEKAFAQNGVQKVTIPETVVTIGRGAFWECASLKEVVFAGQSRLESIIEAAFFKSGLQQFTLPRNVRFCGLWVFKECTNLTSFTFEQGSVLTELPEAMFQGCTNLTEFTIPAQVEIMGKLVFDACSKLKTVKFEDNSQLKDLGGVTFRGTVIEEFTLPATCEQFGVFTFESVASLKKINIPPDSKLKEIGACAFHKTSLTEVTIPVSCESIAEFSFCENPNLSKVNLPDPDDPNYRLERIGFAAFFNTDIKEARVGTTFGNLEPKTFQDCKNFRCFTAKAPSRCYEIGEECFKNTALEYISVPGCKVLGSDCFAGCEKTLKYLRLTDEKQPRDARPMYLSGSQEKTPLSGFPRLAIAYPGSSLKQFRQKTKGSCLNVD